jgi:hypothetical protein
MNTRDTQWLAWLCTLTLVACGDPPRDPTGLAPSFHRDRGDDDRRGPKCFDAHATPVTFGANWALTNPNGSPNLLSGPTVDQVDLVKFEINNSCGVRVGSRKIGSPLAVLVRDNQSTNAALSSAVTRELIDAGAVAVVGGGPLLLPLQRRRWPSRQMFRLGPTKRLQMP